MNVSGRGLLHLIFTMDTCQNKNFKNKRKQLFSLIIYICYAQLGGTQRTMPMTRTTVLSAKGKSDQDQGQTIRVGPRTLFMTVFIKASKYIVIIIFHGMEYVTVNIEET